MKTPLQFRISYRETAALRKEGRQFIPRQTVPGMAKLIVQRYLRDNDLLKSKTKNPRRKSK